jgi:hypothetical protein
MAIDTTPIFVLGSGRSGTRAIFKLLSGIPAIEIHHEYCCTHIQPAAAQYFMGLIDRPAILRIIRDLHGAAVHYTAAAEWMDCSNKLSWIIGPLAEVFPNARFVHLTRDGRKVTASFYHKLAPEIYDDVSVAALQAWLAGHGVPKPPPEKKYWWNVPRPGQPFFEEFPSFNQFQRICYHWREVVRVIREGFREIPPERQLTLKLEDLTTDRAVLGHFLDFVNVPYEEHYFEALQRPQNVFFPMDFKLTENEVEQFKAITGDTMEQLGYDIHSEIYEVKY